MPSFAFVALRDHSPVFIDVDDRSQRALGVRIVPPRTWVASGMLILQENFSLTSRYLDQAEAKVTCRRRPPEPKFFFSFNAKIDSAFSLRFRPMSVKNTASQHFSAWLWPKFCIFW